MIRTALNLSVFLVVAGGLMAAAANTLTMHCGSACGPLGDTEALRQGGIATSLAGLALAPVLVSVAARLAP